MKCRIVYKPDKSVVIIHPVLKSKRLDETEEQWLKRIFDKATPFGFEYDDIDESELPIDREDRNAWEGTKGKDIEINQIKAQEIKDAKKLEKDIQDKLRQMALRKLQGIKK